MPHDVDWQLARALGLSDHYLDQTGARVDINPEIHDRLMEALGFPKSDRADALHEFDDWFHGALPPWRILQAEDPSTIELGVSLIRAEWRLEGERGFVCEGRARRDVELPPLIAGYYTLHIGAHRCFLIVAPPRCYLPPVLEDEQVKPWGLAVQAYGLRSHRNAGFGDFLDIAILSGVLAQRGASFLGLSPLHALFTSDRTKISPYSPSSRLFLEPLYLALDVLGCEDDARLVPLREAFLVDYHKAWSVKRACLEKLFTCFAAHGLSEAQDQRRKQLGSALEDHATFEALSEHFSEQGLLWAGVWPKAFRDSLSPEVRTFAQDHRTRLDFHVWLQLIAETQLAAAAQTARASGMEVGLYRDLAVGADLYGSEVWSRPDRYARTLSVGAPPDPLGPQGQNWGFPPFHPLILQMQDFSGFRDLLAANMRRSGAIRIDHAFQLQRLFVIPSGEHAAQGGYVQFPFEALLAILRIESHRHSCMVIAEDLGTGPPNFSEKIMANGLLSSRLLMFEREADGRFKRPQNYPRAALAAVTTHDLPTFRGWRHGFDLDLRACFGVFSERIARAEHGARRADLAKWREALACEDLDPEAQDDLSARNEALRYLAKTPSILLAVQSEDVLDEINQPNLPGLSDGPPNWRRRMSEPLEGAARDNGPYGKMGALMAEAGRSPRAREACLAADIAIATYRLQLNCDFTFAQAEVVLPYLKALGISHVYLSPIQKARHGSRHCYDLVDPREINPELGGRDDFLHFAEAIHAQGLKLIVDIVPNHMGIGAENPFWWSILAQGSASSYADLFDIDWARGQGRIVLPVLSASYGEALAAHEIKLDFDNARQAFVLRYFERVFPIAEGSLDLADDDTAEVACTRFAHNPMRLHLLLERQHYRLAHWRLAGSVLNYRRFFEINTLAGVRIERPENFELIHRLILDLVDQRVIDGLRIDHVDGLADPQAYLERLQRHVGPGFPVYVEKILARDELLHPWPIAGTTGYDALNEMDGILFDRAAIEPIKSFYQNHIGVMESSTEALRKAKADILAWSFGSELNAIVDQIFHIVQSDPVTRDLSRDSLMRAISAWMTCLPVYRLYVREQDERFLKKAADDARHILQAGDYAALDFFCHVMQDDAQADLRMRLGQLTGPVMAKGLEDTTFYRHAPFLALNEVGGDLSAFGFTLSQFHDSNKHRADYWPASLVATSTHDTKRGEDARARLMALTAVPQDFLDAGKKFLSLCPEITRRDAWFLFQSLIGAWPLTPAEDFEQRMAKFFRKALREAKLETSWADPHEAYEAACIRCLHDVLAPTNEASAIVSGLVEKVQWAGILNGLARTILKSTVPGIPDFYQGCELWDFSLVDPDNRRPVDFARRQHMIASCHHAKPQALLAEWQNGAIKQWLIRRLLQLRHQYHALFSLGDYEPIESQGVAFQRRRGRHILYVQVFTGTQMLRDHHLPASGKLCAPELWHGTRLQLPPGEWRNQLTGTAFGVEGTVNAVEIAEGLPWLILGTAQ